jgi:hypothetical protein
VIAVAVGERNHGDGRVRIIPTCVLPHRRA